MDQEIFKGKSFSNLLEDIYNNSKKKEKQITALIKDLQPMIKSVGDATVIVPIIKEYLEVAVKNDEHLIKMASVVQRAMARTELSGGEFQLTEDEKQQLLDTVKQIDEPVEKPDVKDKLSK